ncbi:MAG: hypothetical protein HY876_10955 [Coriobacteriales bacterium]|nr:hypothetical protein [Coriobacteriales bacterium]
MIAYRANALRVAEVWFDEPCDPSGADVARYVQTTRPPVGASCQVCVSLELDLGRSEDELFANIHKDTRYRIRRGLERDGFVYEVLDPTDSDVIGAFCDFYNHWAFLRAGGSRWTALRNGLTTMDPSALRRYVEAGMLDVSRMSDSEGRVLTWHTHISAGGTVRYHVTAEHRDDFADSKAGQLVGRANRAHYWRDIVRFKDSGLDVYDFAGWHHAFDDEAKIRICNFKSEFGGAVVRQANCQLGITSAGRAAVLARHLAKRAAGREMWIQRVEVRAER